MRLIDAHNLGVGRANPDAFKNREYANGWNNAIKAITEAAPAIAPETLPIVQRLKAELAEVKAERDALLKELSGECGVCSHYDDCIKNHYSCCDGSNWEYCGPKKEE